MSNVSRKPVSTAWGFAGAALLACVACGSSGHPTDTAETSSELAADEDEVDATYATRAPSVGEPGIPRRTCEPRSARECHYYYTDDSGQRQCPLSYQLCKADGSDWLPCGEYRVGESGDPERVE